MKKGSRLNYNKIRDFRALPVFKAFVTFDSYNATHEIIQRMKHSKKCCLWFRPKFDENLKFEGKTLNFSEPDPPINIKWENLEYSKCQRIWRTCLVYFIFSLIIIICFAVILVLKIWTNAPSGVSQCQAENISLTDLS